MSAVDVLFPHLPLALSLAGAGVLAAARRALAQPLALAPAQGRGTLRDVRRCSAPVMVGTCQTGRGSWGAQCASQTTSGSFRETGQPTRARPWPM